MIVLADVIEHLEDPAAALDACAGLLADGGVLCVITPDPSAPLARAAGARWWGYVPAHTCLLPGRTLRELLAARGLVDLRRRRARALVRAALLARRALRARRPRRRRCCAGSRPRRSAAAASRSRSATSGSCSRTGSRSCGRREPLAADRGDAAARHRRAARLPRGEHDPAVAQAMPVDAVDRALLVDDASPDATPEVALREGFELLRLPVEPRLRRQPEGGLRARAARRRRHRRDGPRRQPVRPVARRAHGARRSRPASPTS